MAIRYFLRRGYPNKELIVVDDGSDDAKYAAEARRLLAGLPVSRT
jgi:glycosyltransferase involved in cell wall biosynthesis